jgi:hypothetical protein
MTALILVAIYMFAVGWNVHDQVTTPIIKQEVKRDD